MLLETASLMMKMLFGKINQHIQGFGAVRGALVLKSKHKGKMMPNYLVSCLWALIGDRVQHFHEVLTPNVFRHTTRSIIFPHTDLMDAAQAV